MSASGETEAKPTHTGLHTEAQPKGKLSQQIHRDLGMLNTGYRTHPLPCLMGGRGVGQYVSNEVGGHVQGMRDGKL